MNLRSLARFGVTAAFAILAAGCDSGWRQDKSCQEYMKREYGVGNHPSCWYRAS